LGLGVTIHFADGYCIIWLKGVSAFVEHFGCAVVGDWRRLDVQVSHHGIAVPATHHTDVVHINYTSEHCHCTSCAKGPSAYFLGRNSCIMAIYCHGMMKYILDVFCFYGGAMADSDGRVQLRLVQSMVLDAPCGVLDWATYTISTEVFNQFFVLDAILMGGESAGHPYHII
jgi:hypothetical protein